MRLAIVRKIHTAIGQCEAVLSLLVVVLFFHAAPVHSANTASDLDGQSLTTAQKGEIWDQALHILGGNANVISRWADPVRFAVIADNNSNDLTNHAVAVVREIAELTALPLTIISSEHGSLPQYLKALTQSKPYQLLPCEQQGECANFVVVVTDIDSMQKIASAIPLRNVYQKALLSDQSAVCFFAPFQGASVIRQALVFVREDLSDAMIRTCLQEEIYQSFGLFSDYTDSEYFSFNNRVEPKEITVYDKALLQAVYDFSPGAPVFLVAKRLITNLEK